jgi:hypothetical protein
MHRRQLAFVLVALIVLLQTESAMAKPSPSTTNESSKNVAPGMWGGPNLQIDITAQGATLEFDCATGTILEPIALDANGRFHANGTFQTEGGPVRKDQSPRGQTAVFSGVVEGDTMHLEFTSAAVQAPEKFTLVRGQAGRLHRCK